MKRTYFVPLCVFAGFFLASTIAGVLLTVGFSENLNALDAAFESRFKPHGVYHLLYHEAHGLRLDLSRHQRESAQTTVSFGFVIGLVLLGWAFDRRRLVRKLNAASAPQEPPASEDG